MDAALVASHVGESLLAAASWSHASVHALLGRMKLLLC